jgi:PPOX class probable F420-dependent enzyme
MKDNSRRHSAGTVADKIPETHRDLLTDEARALAYLSTIMPDGTPQVTPLWFNTRDEYIVINSARGRVKDRNMRLRPTVALAIQDRDIDDRYIQIRGRVVAITENEADLNIEDLSMKYTNQHWEPVEGQVRVMYMILPEHVTVGD